MITISKPKYFQIPLLRLVSCFIAVTVVIVVFCVTDKASAQPYAYITNSGSDNVSVIDTSNHMFVANIDVGDEPFGVAVTRDGSFVYVTNRMDDTVSVIDTSTNMETDVINVGDDPSGIAVTPDGAFVYVANRGEGTVSVIDTTSNVEVAVVPVGVEPLGVAVTHDGEYVYVANTGNDFLTVIDTSDNTVAFTVVFFGISHFGVAITPDSVVYTTHTESSIISVTEPVFTFPLDIIGLYPFPYGIAAGPGCDFIYATHFNPELLNTNMISIINTTDNTVDLTVEVGNAPQGVSVTQDGGFVYVANTVDDTVSVIDTSTNTVIDTIDVGDAPAAYGVFIPQGPVDLNCDGIPDFVDECPESDLSPTVIIDGCDSGVENIVVEEGCTLADIIGQIADNSSNHGEFVSGVSHLANKLKNDRIISGNQKGSIASCAAGADIP